MGKKTFKGGLESLIGGKSLERENESVALVEALEPVKQVQNLLTSNKEEVTIKKVISKTKKKPYIKTSFLVDEANYLKLKAVAYYQRKNLQDLINKSFEDFLNNLGQNSINLAVELYNQSVNEE